MTAVIRFKWRRNVPVAKGLAAKRPRRIGRSETAAASHPRNCWHLNGTSSPYLAGKIAHEKIMCALGAVIVDCRSKTHTKGHFSAVFRDRSICDCGRNLDALLHTGVKAAVKALDHDW
jgi:hypothetical protein